MRIGDGPAPEAPHYESPAEELHGAVLEAFDAAHLLTRMALADALQAGTPWSGLPQSVRTLFESVVETMGIADS